MLIGVPSRRAFGLVAVALALGLSATACSGSDDPKPAAGSSRTASAGIAAGALPAAGSCLADHVDDEPAWDQVVECSEPHLYEVIAWVDLPKDLAVDDRDALERRNGELRGDYLRFANQQCTRELSKTAGVAELGFRGVSAADALGAPQFSGTLALALAPADTWRDVRKVACSVRWEDDNGGPVKARSVDAKPVIASFRQATFPTSLRFCEAEDGDGYEVVSCEVPHQQEQLLSFDAQRVLGEQWVDAAKPGKLSRAQWSDLDSVCEPLAEAMLGPGHEQAGLEVMADIGTWGTAAHLPDYHQGKCMVRSTTKGKQLTGSVVASG